MKNETLNKFVFDLNKCVGCNACAMGCYQENNTNLIINWRNIISSNPSHLPDTPLFHLSLACNHCETAHCMINCPANAYYRDEITGAVIHLPEKCIGCKYCTWTCPYDTPKYNHTHGIVEKCTFCNHKLIENQTPSCILACPTGALTLSNENKLEEVKNLPDEKIRLEIKALRNPHVPLLDNSLNKNTAEQPKNFNSVKLKNEWPLLIFSFLASISVGLSLGGVSELLNSIHGAIQVLIILFAGMFSFVHLGKKNRFYRSGLNLKNSWLSREIFFYVLYVVALAINSFAVVLPSIIINSLGVFLLLSIDMLYKFIMPKRKVSIVSGQTLLIAFSLFLFLKGLYLPLVLLSILRLILLYFYTPKIDNSWFFLSAQLILCSVAIVLLHEGYFWPSMGVFMVYEFTWRYIFYKQLIIKKPQSYLV